jgi:LPXTG-site transpeptidase (sortase) family protein
MRHRFAIFGLAVTLFLGACSAVSPAPDETPSSTSAPATTTTSTNPPAESMPPVTSGPPRSPLADFVASIGSAQYDPEDHSDDRPVPVSISIDSVGIEEATVLGVGVEDDGDMEIPGADGVGWYRFNATPGEEGSAVLAAHISYDGRPGVFRYLDEASVGDRVVIEFDDGSTGEFEIVELAQYDKEELPKERVFSKTGDPVLTLITCGGDFNRSLRSYEDNVVAYAVPVAS